MLTKDLERRHPEYDKWLKPLDVIELLYCGGAMLEKSVSSVLIKRPMEVSDVFEARARMFNYQNIIGTALGWYEAAMFADEVAYDVSSGGKTATADRYEAFLGNCDRKGTAFTDFFRRVFIDAALYQRSFVLVDRPAQGAEFKTLAEQRAAGALEPYLVRFDRRQVINWGVDRFGVLEWLVIEQDEAERGFGAADKEYRYWRYYDRTQFKVFRAEMENGKPKDTAVMVDVGMHALSESGSVPFVVLELPDALWLGNRAYLPAKAHVNKMNAHDWGMFIACLPMPVLKGFKDEAVRVSETAFIRLEEDGDAFYLEPSGVAFEHQANSIASLREEIYRQLYLQAQGRSTEATPAAQSGFSKEMDMAPARDVLGKFGDAVRAAMEQVLSFVALARGEDATFSVRGFSFEEADAEHEVKLVTALEMGNCPSPSLVKEKWKCVARVVAPDQPEAFYADVDKEIDAGVMTPEERADAEVARQKELLGAKMKAKPQKK